MNIPVAFGRLCRPHQMKDGPIEKLGEIGVFDESNCRSPRSCPVKEVEIHHRHPRL